MGVQVYEEEAKDCGAGLIGNVKGYVKKGLEGGVKAEGDEEKEVKEGKGEEEEEEW